MPLEHVDALIDAHFPALQGWMDPDKAKRLARLVAETPRARAPSCVELGVFGGRGIIAMGLAVKHCLGERGRVDGIDAYSAAASLEGRNHQDNDTWWAKLDYPAVLQSARDGIARLGLGAIVRIKVQRSQDSPGDYEDESIDVLHQDSNHSEEVSCYEVATWTSKMRPGGFWVFDDTNWPTTKLAQDHLTRFCKFERIEEHETWAIFRAP